MSIFQVQQLHIKEFTAVELPENLKQQEDLFLTI